MTCDFLSLAAPGVRTLQPYQPGKPESELRREYGLSDIVKLASNENPLGPSPRALTAIHDAHVLPNGNVLLQQGWTKIQEVTRDKKVVWEWPAN